MIRYLRTNEKSAVPRHWLFFDTETREKPINESGLIKQHDFRLGCYRYVLLDGGEVTASHYGQFVLKDAVWDVIDKYTPNNDCLWVCSHNLYFDLTTCGFWEQMEKGRYRVKVDKDDTFRSAGQRKRNFRGHMVLSWRPTFLYLCSAKGRVHFVDSLNYVQSALATIGDNIGFPKYQMPALPDSDDRWFDYCMRDVEVLSQMMTSLLKRWHQENCGNWQPTAAGLAMTNFRHTYRANNKTDQLPKIEIDDDPKKIENERLAYFGGQSECWYYGRVDKPVVVVDVNGLYPYVMRMHEYPYKMVYKSDTSSVDEIRHYLRDYGVIASVRIMSSKEAFPVHVGKRQIHAVGNYWTVLCGSELGRAFKRNVIESTGFVLVYKLAPLFRRWVDYWWKRRIDAKIQQDLAGELYAKAILLSLSGKWAQSSRRWVDRFDVPACKRWGEWTHNDYGTNTDHHFRAIAGNVQEQIDGGATTHCFPAISAFITAHGREHMRRIREMCLDKSVYHQSTDALVMDHEEYEELVRRGMVDDTMLGKLKVIRKANEAIFIGVNNYSLDDQWVKQGLWGRAYQTDGNTWQADVWQRIEEAIKRKPPDGPLVFTESLSVETVQPKGTIGSDGWVNPPELWFPSDKDHIRYLTDGSYDDDVLRQVKR